MTTEGAVNRYGGGAAPTAAATAQQIIVVRHLVVVSTLSLSFFRAAEQHDLSPNSRKQHMAEELMFID